jgi:alcohol dehydrogenase YqhD (iron-dependent ADH family)
MQNFSFHNPTKILFGKDVIDQLGTEASFFGRKVMMVYGRSSIKMNGIYDRAILSLKRSGLEVVEFSGIKSNPVLSHLRQGIAIAKKEQPDLIVAVGGGSVLDEAKAIAAGAVTDVDVWDFFTNSKEVEDALPLVTMLTVAATGSEMNPTGVVTNEDTLQKFEISSPHLYPKASLLDPTALYTLPASYTAFSAVDAISHVIEGYFTGNDPHTPMQDRLVESIILTIMESCETCLADPENYQSRATFMWAATLALNGLPTAGIGTYAFPNHMIEHSLSAIYDIAHGAGLSIVIPGWMQYASESDPVKFAHFAERIFNITEGSGRDRAQKGIDALKTWFTKIGSPVSLKDSGIPEDDIFMISENALMLAKKWGMQEYSREIIEKILHNCH